MEVPGLGMNLPENLRRRFVAAGRGGGEGGVLSLVRKVFERGRRAGSGGCLRGKRRFLRALQTDLRGLRCRLWPRNGPQDKIDEFE